MNHQPVAGGSSDNNTATDERGTDTSSSAAPFSLDGMVSVPLRLDSPPPGGPVEVDGHRVLLDGHAHHGNEIQVDGEAQVDGHAQVDGYPEVDGRAYAGQSNDNDDGDEILMSEGELLERLHTMHHMLLSPQQDHIVTGHLARVHAKGRRSQILDVGTGTGTWATTLARRHPYADVVGIDIDWSSFRRTRLPHGNADFYTVDVTMDIPWEENTFDLIHVKSMLMDIPRYRDLIKKLSKMLRPGGLLILVESELTYQCIQGTPSESLSEFSDALTSTLAARETDVNLPPNLDRPIAETGVFSAQFYFQEIGCPVGPYVPGSSNLQYVGQIQMAVLNAALNRLVCRRIETGPERTQLLRLIKACTLELRSSTARYLQRLFAVYAYKKIMPHQHHSRYSM